jgi:hypothetical protein
LHVDVRVGPAHCAFQISWLPAVTPQKSMLSTSFWFLKAFWISQVPLLTLMCGLPQLLGSGVPLTSAGA